MATKKADPRTSAGARMERESMRRHLRREINRTAPGEQVDRVGALTEVLRWLLARSRRYSRRPGGLGR